MSNRNSESLSDNEIMTIRDVAGFLKVTPKTIQNWIARRQFPFVKIGAKHFVLKTSLDEWVRSKERKEWL